jgi:hypothetical protein
MATGAFGTIRNGLVVVSMCAGMAAGALGAGATAEARVSGPRTTQMAWECGLIQDAYDQAKKDIKNAVTSVQRINAQNALERAVNSWYDNGCYELFGLISRVVQDGGQYQDPITSAGNQQVAQPGRLTSAPTVATELAR